MSSVKKGKGNLKGALVFVPVVVVVASLCFALCRLEGIASSAFRDLQRSRSPRERIESVAFYR